MSQAGGPADNASAQFDSGPPDRPNLRAKLVGILSNTANGCLTELGYFPGLMKRLQELEQSNAQWKAENVKLFRDNRTLVQLTQYQDRLKVANAATDNSGKVAFLEEQVKSLSIQNAELRKRNETLVGAPNAHYQQLISDYQQLAALYRTAVSEIGHLRQMIKIGPDFQRHYGTVPQPNIPRTPDAQHEQCTPISQTLPPPSNPSMPQKMHLSTAGPHSASYPLKYAFQQPLVSINRDGHLGMVATTGMPGAAHRPPSQQHLMNPTHQKLTGSANVMATSIPVGQPTSNPYRRLSLNINTSAITTSSEMRHSPSIHQPDIQNSLNAIPNPQSAPGGPTMMQCPQPNSRPASVWHPPQIAVSPLSPTARSSAPNTPAVNSAPYKSMSPPESAEIVTPTTGIRGRSSAEVVSSPVLGIEQLKRAREEAGDDLNDQLGSLQKKARLEEENRVTHPVKPDEDAEEGKKEKLIAPVKPDEIVEEGEKENLDGHAKEGEKENRVTYPVKSDEDAEEESEQEIEVDSDGLRSVASCISEVMQTSAQDSEVQTCQLCDLRHKNGYISEPAKPFLRATQEDLIRHLTTEHAEAWETLRQDV